MIISNAIIDNAVEIFGQGGIVVTILENFMPIVSWTILLMYACLFSLACLATIGGPGGWIFTAISFAIGGVCIVLGKETMPAGGIICLLALLNGWASRQYAAQKVTPYTDGSWEIGKYGITCNKSRLYTAAALFSLPALACVVLAFGVEPLWQVPAYALFIFCMRSMLLYWADPFLIREKGIEIYTLRDYRTVRAMTGWQEWCHLPLFWFKESGPYTADLWKQRQFIDHLGSTYRCAIGEGIFGTGYLIRIQLETDGGKVSPPPVSYLYGWRLHNGTYRHLFSYFLFAVGMAFIAGPAAVLFMIGQGGASAALLPMASYMAPLIFLGIITLFFGIFIRRKK